ncbi:Ribonucleoside-diphosphate reductase large subunit-like protein [Frankliniella fusca]|uniref:Ribonucleoside-diphosphate reductase large subunit-like protein n=1 Tax=Frankliniella fusca TaxID=407009 RepID=A0AAE1I3C5_9NEOP|nr:Ribonucleoside-diphosphate reductase large subunit-like protein [Frankliniella fusca]
MQHQWRSSSLRQGLSAGGRRKSSLEDIGLQRAEPAQGLQGLQGLQAGLPGLQGLQAHSPGVPRVPVNPIKIALNGSIGLEVTPPDQEQQGLSPGPSPGGLSPGAMGGSMGGSMGGAMGGLGAMGGGHSHSPPSPSAGGAPSSPVGDPQNLQGTIV